MRSSFLYRKTQSVFLAPPGGAMFYQTACLSPPRQGGLGALPQGSERREGSQGFQAHFPACHGAKGSSKAAS